jgi:hypothetical protein
MDVLYMRLFCVCAVPCGSRGLATSSSPVQGVLPSVQMINETEKSALCSKVEARRKKKCSPLIIPLIRLTNQ